VLWLVKVKVTDEASTPLMSINSGTSYFSYSLDVVTSVATWYQCFSRYGLLFSFSFYFVMTF